MNDINTVMQYFEDRNRHYSTFSGENLVHTLNLQEYVNIEGRRETRTVYNKNRFYMYGKKSKDCNDEGIGL